MLVVAGVLDVALAAVPDEDASVEEAEAFEAIDEADILTLDTIEATDELADTTADEIALEAPVAIELAAETAEEDTGIAAWRTQISAVMGSTFRVSELEQAEAMQGVACLVIAFLPEPHWQA